MKERFFLLLLFCFLFFGCFRRFNVNMRRCVEVDGQIEDNIGINNDKTQIDIDIDFDKDIIKSEDAAKAELDIFENKIESEIEVEAKIEDEVESEIKIKENIDSDIEIEEEVDDLEVEKEIKNKDNKEKESVEYEEELYVLVKKTGCRRFVIFFPELKINRITAKLLYEYNNNSVDCNVLYDIKNIKNSSEIYIEIENVPNFKIGALKFWLTFFINEDNRIDINSEVPIRIINKDIVIINNE